MPPRNKIMTDRQREQREKTPPRYRDRLYRDEQRALYSPDYSESSVRFLVRRMAEPLEKQLLGEAGVQAFTVWMTRLIWDESIWLATASYVQHGEIMKEHLYSTFRYQYPSLVRELKLIEDALIDQLRNLPDFYSSGRPDGWRHLRPVRGTSAAS